MTPWTRSTAPFISEIAGLAGGLMGGSSSPPAGNATSQTVATKAKGSKANVNFVVGTDGGGGGAAPAEPVAGAAEGGFLDPALMLAVMVFVLVLVAVVALLGR